MIVLTSFTHYIIVEFNDSSGHHGDNSETKCKIKYRPNYSTIC